MTAPSTLRQIALTLLLLILDVLLIAWLFWTYAWTGWNDGWNPGNPPEAPALAVRATWILAATAVLSAAGLLALRCRIPAAAQLLFLGPAAALFSFFPALD